MASTVMIHDNNLILTNGGLAGRRGRATLSMLYRALQGATAAGETLPTVEFTMTQEDRSKVSGTWWVLQFLVPLAGRMPEKQHTLAFLM